MMLRKALSSKLLGILFLGMTLFSTTAFGKRMKCTSLQWGGQDIEFDFQASMSRNSSMLVDYNYKVIFSGTDLKGIREHSGVDVNYDSDFNPVEKHYKTYNRYNLGTFLGDSKFQLQIFLPKELHRKRLRVFHGFIEMHKIIDDAPEAKSGGRTVLSCALSK